MTIPAPSDPFAAFGVGRVAGAELTRMVQRLGPGLTDHRGLIELPALAVLFDDIGGLPFFFSGPGHTSPGVSIQARLSMSMTDRPEIDEVLDASAQLVMHSGGYGSTVVSITGADARPLCLGTARNVRVGRPLVTGDDHFTLPAPSAPAGLVAAAPDSSRSGRDIVAGLAAAYTSLGPIGELLGGAIEFDGDELLFTSRTAAWMANIMGTMHGGVIAAIVAQGVSFAAQATTAPGVGYQLIEFGVAFLRSPAVDGRSLTVRTRPIKVGRRLGVFEASLYDGEVLLAHATADVRYDAPA